MSPKTTKTKGKRYPLNMRTTKEVRDSLEDMAEQTGRSLAQEVEARLDRSFYLDAVFAAIHGPNADLVYALSTAVALSTTLDLDEQDQYRALQVAAVHLIAALSRLEVASNQQVRSVEWLINTPYAMKGLSLALQVLQSIGAPEPIAHLKKITEELVAEVAKKRAADLLQKQDLEPSAISEEQVRDVIGRVGKDKEKAK